MTTKTPTYPPILDDLPSPIDRLGFEPYVLALSDILLDADTHTPLTLGLFGSWGSGKTSLMRQMQIAVEGQGGTDKRLHFRTVWFNAWKYNQEQDLWRALLLVLLDDLEQLLEKEPLAAAKASEPPTKPSPQELLELLREALYRETAWTESGKRTVNWADLVTGAGGLATSLLLGGPWQAAIAAMFDAKATEEAKKEFGKGKPASDLGKIIGAFRREELVHYQAQLRSLEQFQENFSLLVKTLLRPKGEEPRRLVVFVDDLDRCLPGKAIEVLEALKLFLDVEGCIFVLALDDEAIESAIRQRYQGEVKAREYLEKIVQVPFVLPPIEAEPMRTFVAALAPALPDKRCAEVFAVGLGSNPRQVKRILNIFLLLSRLVERRPELKDAIQPVRLAKFVVIQHVYPELYDLLKLTPGYLIDLDRHFQDARPGDPMGEETGRQQPLPEAVAQYGANPDLRRLLLCVDGANARFFGRGPEALTPEALKPYITLARQATPMDAPTRQTGRLSFEPEMAQVPAGSFLLGTSPQEVEDLIQRFAWAKDAKERDLFRREQPQHEVTLSAFEIGRYPVLNVEYAEFVRAAGARAPLHWPGGKLPEEMADHPVVNVSWQDALGYVQWLAERTGKPYRLPTEAEWEKAARGEKGWLWPWGNDWDPARVNYKPDGPDRTTARGQYSPAGDSPYGCADMAGNVWEWCSSIDRPYPYMVEDGRESLQGNERRVLRGGSWNNDTPNYLRCAYRARSHPNSTEVYLGFRVARDLLR